MRALPAASVRTLVGAAIVALALPGATAVRTTPDLPDRRAPRSETLELVFREGTEVDVDVAGVEPGFDPGDYNLKMASVFRGDTNIGQVTQHCTLMRLVQEPGTPESLVHCTIHLMLTKGQVVVAGSFDVFEGPPVLAVTGGTGKYRGVLGELEETGADGEDPLAELRLSYPRR
jgi:hypothetical protein